MTKRGLAWVLAGAFLLVILAAVALVGVRMALGERERQSMSAGWGRLRLGMTAQEVEAVLGSPTSETPDAVASVPTPDGWRDLPTHRKAWRGRRYQISAYFDGDGRLIHKTMVPLGYWF